MSIVSALLDAQRREIYESAISTAKGRTAAAELLGEARRTVERHAAYLGFTKGTQQRNPTGQIKRLTDEELEGLARIAKPSAMPRKLNVRVHGYMCISNDCSTRGINLELKGKEKIASFINQAIDDEFEGLSYLFGENGVPLDSIDDAEAAYS